MLSRLGTAFEVDIPVVQVNCDQRSLNAGKFEIASACRRSAPTTKTILVHSLLLFIMHISRFVT